MHSHCLRCRNSTATKGGSIQETANGRTQYKGQCVVCGGNKAQFVSKDQVTTGKGVKTGVKGRKQQVKKVQDKRYESGSDEYSSDSDYE